MKLTLELTFAGHDGQAVSYDIKEDEKQVGILEVFIREDQHLSIRLRRIDESKVGAATFQVV